jgi:hypothetical protein
MIVKCIMLSKGNQNKKITYYVITLMKSGEGKSVEMENRLIVARG